jgi:IS30 family transposase
MQNQIKELKDNGLKNIEIARKLNISESTVSYHLNPDYRRRVYLNVKNRRMSNKTLAVQSKGGCCQICKYDKCISALEFHHLDPTKKDPILKTSKRIPSMSFDFIKNELNKCILLCCRCHREVHAGLINLESSSGAAPLN